VKLANPVLSILYMADALDLDISNYTIRDLEVFFRYKPGDKFTASDIEYKETVIREQLLKSGHIDKKMKRDLISFLTSAKDWLIAAKCKIPTPTTLPKLPALDQTQYPAATIMPDLGDRSTREQNLVENPPVQYIHSLPGEFMPGSLNPINSRVITKCVTIDTRFRENYFGTTSADMMIQLPIKLSKIVSMQLTAIELPVSFYTVSSIYGNNYLYIQAKYLVSGDETEYIDNIVLFMPDGNYNGPDMITYLNELMAPVDASGTLLYPNRPFSYMNFVLDITVTGSGTGKVYLTSTDTDVMVITEIILDFTLDSEGNVDNTDISRKLGWNLGYRKRHYSGNTFYNADCSIEPNTLRYIYLAIDDFHNSVNNHFMTIYQKNVVAPNILARITLRGSFFSMIMDNDLNLVTEPRKYFGPVDIQKLRVRLLTDRGDVLPMNGSDFSFCLTFKQLYE
jgi:hypothetical protein